MAMNTSSTIEHKPAEFYEVQAVNNDLQPRVFQFKVKVIGKYKYLAAASVTSMAVTLSGCVTLSGNYRVSLQDGTNGAKTEILAQGSGIYTARNALCSMHPGAVVVIRDAASGEELKGESPYHCH